MEPKVQKKRSLAPDRRKVVTDEVNEWLKAGIVRRVRYPTWVANPVLVKKVDGSWRMCIDFKDLNKACPKDLYPLPEIDWKIESLMGFQYKCFLDAYKGYHQIQMTKKDEEKTAFHMEEGVFLYTRCHFLGSKCGRHNPRDWWTLPSRAIGVNLEAIVRPINGHKANPENAKRVMDMSSPKTLKQMQSLSGKLAALNRFLSRSAERSLPFLDTLKKCTNKKDFRWTEAAEAAFLEMKKLQRKQVKFCALLTERNGRQMPLYTVSRSLQGAETNYAPMEKLALALVHAARRLRRGLWHKRVVSRVAIKGQVLADFLADTPAEISATAEVPNNPRVEDIPEPSNARGDLTPGPKAWRLYTDGASNNEGSGAGLILIAPDDAGMRIAKEMQVRDIHTFVDSKLVASQVEGSYEAKGGRMIKYREKVLELAGTFNRFRITHIPRAEQEGRCP
ncbi:reverse transcriptase domain-containing protein [Tanacetum coccineum]